MSQEANAEDDGWGVLDRTFGPLELEHDQDVFFRHSPVNRYWKGSAEEELPTDHGARYVSGLTIYDEIFARGRLLGRYRSAHGPHTFDDSLDAFMAQFLGERPLEAFDLVIDGQSLDSHWRWASASKERTEAPGVHAIIRLEHTVRPVTVAVHTVVDSTPVMTRWLEITNTGERPAALTNVAVWSGLLMEVTPGVPHTQDIHELVSFRDGAFFSLGRLTHTTWGHEGSFSWQALTPGTFTMSTPHGSSGWGLPFFLVKGVLKSEVYIGHLAWSGNWEISFYNDCFDNRGGHVEPYRSARLFFRAGPKAPAPQRLIAPGETVATPALHLGHVDGPVDAAVQAMHTHIRQSVMPRCGEHSSVGHWVSPKNVKQQRQLGRATVDEYIRREIDAYSAIGANLYQLCEWHGNPRDQAFVEHYQRGRGDWYAPSHFTTSLKEFGDIIRAGGTRLQMWMEPEVADPGTGVAAAHPDWFVMRDGERISNLGSRNRDQRYSPLLDLSLPEAAEWVEQQVAHVIEDYSADEIMWDYNARPGVGGQRRVGDHVEDTAWRYYENLYGLLKRLAEKHPHVTWLNCASGGARSDLGILQCGARATVVSDYSVMPRAIKMINGLTMALPPEALCYFTNHIEASTRWTDWQTQMRASLLCGSSFLGLHPVREYGMKGLWQQTARYISLFHTFTSPVIKGCRVYHHTPDCPVDQPGAWCVLEYVGQDRVNAYAGIFRLEQAESDAYVFRPQGLDAAADYEVELDSSNARFVRSGQTLSEDGIRVRLAAPLTSELLLFCKVNS